MKLRVLATALIAGSVLFSGLAKADKLDDIKQAGVVRIAIFDSNPPFGFIDPQTKNWQVMMQILRMKLPKISG